MQRIVQRARPAYFVAEIAMRRLRANLGGTLILLVGTVLATGFAAAAPIYIQAVRDLGLTSTIDRADPRSLDLRYELDGLATDEAGFNELEALLEQEVRAAAGSLVEGESTLLRSRTFLVREPGVAPPADPESAEAFFLWHSEYPNRIALIAGDALPGWDGRGALPVLIDAETARARDLSVGDSLLLRPSWDADRVELEITVHGLFRPIDEPDGRWLPADARVGESIATAEYHLWVTRDDLLVALGASTPQMRTQMSRTFFLALDDLESSQVDAVRERLAVAESRLALRVPGLRQISDLPATLADYDESFVVAQSEILVIVLQLVAAVLIFLIVVAAMRRETQGGDKAVLIARGVPRGQIVATDLVASALIVVPAVIVAPFLGRGMVALLGLVPPFDASPGRFLATDLVPAAWYLALAVGGCTLATILIPSILETRESVVATLQRRGRPRADQLQRRAADGALLGLAALAAFELRRSEPTVETPLVGDVSLDLLAVATPAVLLLALGLIVIRAFPLLAQGAGLALRAAPGTALLLGVWYMARSSTHYARVAMLLVLVAALAVFTASFGSTLSRSYDERALYEVGSTVRLTGSPAISADVAEIARELSDASAAQTTGVAAVQRFRARLSDQDEPFPLTVLAADTEALSGVAFLRDDFAPRPLGPQLTALADPGKQTRLEIPAAGATLAIWVRFTDVRAGTSLFARLRDGAGNYWDYVLATVEEDERPASELFVERGERAPVRLLNGDGAVLARRDEVESWHQVSANLQQPAFEISLAGRRFLRSARVAAPSAPPAAPFEVVALMVQTGGAGARGTGRMVVDDFRWQAADGEGILADFDGRTGWSLIGDGITESSLDRLIETDIEARRGPGALALEWVSRPGFTSFSFGPERDHERLRALFDSRVLREADLDPGDVASVAFGSRALELEVSGVLDRFPTYRTDSDDGLIIVDRASLERLALTSGSGLSVRGEPEIWIDGGALSAQEVLNALELSARTEGVHSAAAVRAALEADPLIVAAWKGIFAGALVVVAVAAAFALLLLTVTMARARTTEFAVLRSVGFSVRQMVAMLAVEQGAVLLVGLGVGLLVGTQADVALLDLFAVTPDGLETAPPLVFQIDWRAVGIIAGALAGLFTVTLAVVLAILVRLDTQFALRNTE